MYRIETDPEQRAKEDVFSPSKVKGKPLKGKAKPLETTLKTGEEQVPPPKPLSGREKKEVRRAAAKHSFSNSKKRYE